ncbi:MAG: hypothetical protein ACO1RA_14380 [Planctomycetaceae bacterium]
MPISNIAGSFVCLGKRLRKSRARLQSLLSASALVMALAGVCDAREWTDEKGRKIEAEFVRVEGENVLLDTGTKTYKVPLKTLSQADQDHIKTLTRPAAPADSTTTDESGPDSLRKWTDTSGRLLEAQFVRAAESMIYLRANGQDYPISFLQLSHPDQDYVCKLLTKRGETSLAGTLTNLMNASGPAVPASAAPPSVPTALPPGSYPGATPGGTPPIPTVGNTGINPPGYGMPPSIAGPSGSPTALSSSPIPTGTAPGGTYSPPAARPSPTYQPEEPTYVPESSSSSSGSSIRITGRSIRGLATLVFLILGGLGWMARKMVGDNWL